MLVNYAYLYLSIRLRRIVSRSIKLNKAALSKAWRNTICILCILSLLAPTMLIFVQTVRAYGGIPGNGPNDDFLVGNIGGMIGMNIVPYQPTVFDQPTYRYAEESAVTSAVSQQPFQPMFVENVGQFDVDVKYVLQGSDGSVFLTENAIWITLFDEQESGQMPNRERHAPPERIPRHGVNLRITFPGANQASVIEGFDPLDVQLSYFLGSDPDVWQSGVPVWGGVRYRDIYPGVDLEISSIDGEWDWRFVTDDAENLATSSVSIEGAENIAFPSESGVIQVETGFGVAIFPGFRALDRLGGTLDLSDFQAGEIINTVIDRPFRTPAAPQDNGTGPAGKLNSLAQEVILDEDGSLGKVFSTFIGGVDVEYMAHSVVDQNGNTYVALDTCSSDLEETPGSISENFPESCDVYVAKLSVDGSSLLYGVYFGGNDGEDVWGLDVDLSGNVYVTGITFSLNALDPADNFPTTPGAFQTVPGDTSVDGFVTKINQGGTSLVFSSFLGGDNSDYPEAITADANENVYVAGSTRSTEDTFPITPGVYQEEHSPGYNFDGFVGKINPSGTTLEYLTYLGGDSSDYLWDIAVNENGEVYVVGDTSSSNYPSDSSSYQPGNAGGSDIVVTALNSTASDYIYSTFIGGTMDDWGMAIALDQSGEVVITGTTYSTTLQGFPVKNAYQSELSGTSDAFVIRIEQDGSQLVFSTYWGGSSIEDGAGIAIDRQRNIWIAGITWSADFPKPDQVELNGSSDIFLSGFSPLGDSLIYSSIFGGSGEEFNWCCYSNTNLSCWEDTITVSGITDSQSFPFTSGAYQETYGGSFDGFVTRFYLPETVVPDEITYSDNCPEECSVSAAPGGVDANEGDPINTRNGGWLYTNTDISVPVHGGSLNFTRFYNSLVTDLYSALLGYGWTHNHDLYLTFVSGPETQEAIVVFKGPSANQYTFIDLGDGVYQPYPGLLATLEQDPGPPVTYTLVDSAQNMYRFDENGVIQERVDANGVSLSYDYNVDGTLDTVTDSTGLRYLKFIYTTTTPARIDTVILYTGSEQRQVSFTYTNSDLVTYTDLMGDTWSYGYNLNHQVEDIYAPPLSSPQLFLHTDYDAEGRAYQQFDGEGNRLAYITYYPDGTSVAEDAFGNQTVYTYDSRNTLSDSSSPLGNGASTIYDYNFRPIEISYAEETDSFMTMQWSDDGVNLMNMWDAFGNETELIYDELNNLRFVIDPNTYETEYYYEDPNFPTQVTKIEYPISYDGGVTWMRTEYEYYQPDNPEGQPAGEIRTITDRGLRTYYEYNQFGQVTLVRERDNTDFPLITVYTYDDFGRLVETLSPDGVRTRTEYDDADRITRVIENCWPDHEYPDNCITTTYEQNYQNSEGIFYNLVSNYVYDSRGNQIAVENTLGHITRTYYDSFGRVTTVVRNWSGSIEDILNNPEAPPPDRETESTPVSNLRTDYIYDQNGRQIESIDTAGIVTRSYYDADGRRMAVVQNYVEGPTSTYPWPDFDSAYPDQNILTRYYYDSRGNLIATSDVDGRITRTYYDAANRPYVVVQNWAGTIQDLIAYPDSSPPERASSTADSNLITETVYDPSGNVIATIDPAGIITRTYYDSLNRPITVVQNLDGISLYANTPPDRSSSPADKNIRTDTIYDVNGRVVATVDPRGFVTRRIYNELGQLTQVIVNESTTSDPNEYNMTTNYTYDEYGRQVETVSPNGMRTRTEYGADGRVARVIQNCKFSYPEPCIDLAAPPLYPQNFDDEYNIITSYSYDALGRRVTTTDTLGHVTERQYDAVGRVIKVTQNKHPSVTTLYYLQEYNIVTEYTYDLTGNQIAVTAPPTTNPQGTITRTYFDDLHRPISVVQNWDGADIYSTVIPDRGSNNQNIRTDTVYYGNGTVFMVIDEIGLQTIFGYDLLGRRTSSTDPHLSTNPNPNTTEYRYDISGNQYLVTDANDVATKYEYDQLGRLIRVIENYVEPDPDPEYTVDTNVRTEYTYDIMGNRKTIRDGNATLNDTQDFTTFTYDALNRLQTETDPIGNTWVYEYDAVGNRDWMLDANGIRTYYGYDSLNRLIGIDYNNSDTLNPVFDVTFVYDALGRRTDMTDGVGNTHWEPDGLGRVEFISDPFGDVVSYEYDALGNRTQITYPDSKTVDYVYDALGRLDHLTDWQVNPVPITYTYDAASRLTDVSLPNGVTSTFEYDDANRLDSITHDIGATNLNSYSYTTDAVGNRTDVAEYLYVGSGTASIGNSATASAEWIEATEWEFNFWDVSWAMNIDWLMPHVGSDSADLSVYAPIVYVQESDSTPTSAAVVTPTPTLDVVESVEPTTDPTATPAPTPTETAIPDDAAPGDSPRPDPVSDGDLVVNAIGDRGDLAPGDGICDTGRGNCTLRAALEEANTTRELDTIVFDISGEGPYLIQLLSPLPEIISPVVINGATQAGYTGTPLIVLDGTLTGDWTSGLTINANGSEVTGLAIINFEYAGIHVLSDGNLIMSNYIGVATDGITISGNGIGILIDNSNGTVIGGDARADGNLISGNQTGVYIYGKFASENLLQANLIGTDASGQAVLGNQIGVRINASPENQIGTNLISGNQTGIMIQGREASGNRVFNNQIGSAEAGDREMGNGEVGVWILDAPGNTIGGLDTEDSNRILGNGQAIRIQGEDAIDNLIDGNELEDLLPTETELSAERVQAEGNLDDDSPNFPEDAENEDLSPANESEASSFEVTYTPGEGFSLPASSWMDEAGIYMAVYHLPLPIISDGVYAPMVDGAVLVVDSTGDGADSNPGDGVCADSSSNCTLRAAIQEANALPGADTINFNIPGTGPHTIQPLSALPAISGVVVIDGSTQSGYTGVTPMIVIDGSGAGAGAIGLRLTGGASTIRGLVINNFDGAGIDIRTAGGNTIVANFIGTDSSGAIAAPNFVGIKVTGTSNNTIGGVVVDDRNLISGNTYDGIYLTTLAAGTLIQGNYIGTNISGSLALPNGGDGIEVRNVSNTTIGGTESSAGNLISGNNNFGVRLTTGGSGAIIQGNRIGTNAAGTSALPNNGIGILLSGALSTTIGGTESGAGNLISGNIGDGIYLSVGSDNTLIQGNYIGTDITGTLALANNGGIEVQAVTNTTIGGAASGAGNLISGSSSVGIFINSGADGTLIQGNKIGTDINGTSSLANGAGIRVTDSTNTTIGGTISTARNLISGNTYDGIIVADGADGVIIQGNYIGTDISGTLALPNQDDGVDIEDSTGTTLGGTAVGAGNLISGNGNHGIEIYDSTTPPNGVVIQGNLVGTDLTGAEGIPNVGYGIILDGITDAVIGGTETGAGNTIAFNGLDGITVVNNSSGVNIRGNSIFENYALGIDLGYDRVTANDLGDPDTGPNGLQNFPMIDSVTSDGVGSSTIVGTLNSTASTIFQLEFFASVTCDPDGNGEGEIYLGGREVITDGSGDVNFTEELTIGIPDGYQVTGVATDPAGNTSEFSACQPVVIIEQEDMSYQWHYEYDPLYRLAYACTEWDGQACLGDEFSYTYDAVGNRKSQTEGGKLTTYDYDIANRLIYECTEWDVVGATCIGQEITYTWDNNGNLLSDDTNTYTYDYANRLMGLTDGVNTYSYTYNGLGDRLQQTVNGLTTTYTLDLNTGLTQVLGDGTTWYLYGLGRVGEYGASWEYYLTDALGSVRQLTDGSGAVTMAQSYEPYGDVMVSYGVGDSNYGFASEWTDAYSGLIYLRSRYYDVSLGRLISRDPFSGITTGPASFNKYVYAMNNPVRYGDPQGTCPPCWILLILGITTIACRMSSSTGPEPTPTLGPIPVIESLEAYTSGVSIRTDHAQLGYVYNFDGPVDYHQDVIFETGIDSPGIVFLAKIDIPDGAEGSIEWAQTVMLHIEFERRDNRSQQLIFDDHWYLDTASIYPVTPVFNVTPGMSGIYEYLTIDSPSVPLDPIGIRGEVIETFRMFLMWRPIGATDEQRVPLAAIDWGWSAVLENIASEETYNNWPWMQQWQIVSSNWHPNPSGLGRPTTVMPDLSTPLIPSELSW